MFLNIQTQFYSTYCLVIQSESYKSVQVESKSLFYSFPLWVALHSTGHRCQATSATHSYDHTLELLCPEIDTPLQPFPRPPFFRHREHFKAVNCSLSTHEGTSWSHAFPILASTPVSSHLPFLPHLIDKTPPWTTVLICFLSSCTPAKEPHTCRGHGTFRVSDLKP